MLIAVKLVGITHGFVEAHGSIVANRQIQILGCKEEFHLALFLAAGSDNLLLELHNALDLLVSEEDSFQNDLFGKLIRSRLDHHDGVVRPCHGQIQVGNRALLLRRIDDELSIHAADLNACDRSRKGDI